MGNAAAENKRVRQAVTEALFALMKRKNFSEISVSDIVKEAKVARASFYRNFESREAVIDAFIRDFHAAVTRQPDDHSCSGSRSQAQIVEQLERSFAMVLSKKAYVLALYNSGFQDRLQYIADAYIEELAGDMRYSSADKYILYCYSGAGMNMMVHWLRDGANESPHELAVACAGFFQQKFR